MKSIRENAPTEQKLQQIESLMKNLGISIEFLGTRTIVHNLNNNCSYEVLNIENGNVIASFPRNFDTEKLCIIE